MQLKSKKTAWFVIAVLVMLVVAMTAIPMVQKHSQYQNAVALYNEGEYETAQELFGSLGNYQDAAEMETECRYQFAEKLLTEKQFDRALTMYKELGEYRESITKITECQYRIACQLQEDKRYEEAISVFQMISGYSDSALKLRENNYLWAKQLFDEKQYGGAKPLFVKLGTYKDSKKYLTECETMQMLDTLVGTWISDGSEMDEALALEKKKETWLVDKFGATTIKDPTALKLLDESDDSFKMKTEIKINVDGTFTWALSETMLAEMKLAKKIITQETYKAMYEKFCFTSDGKLNSDGKRMLATMKTAHEQYNAGYDLNGLFEEMEMSEEEQFDFLFLSDGLYESGAESEINELRNEYKRSGKLKIDGEDLIFMAGELTIRCKLSETGTTINGIIDGQNSKVIHNKKVIFHRA